MLTATLSGLDEYICPHLKPSTLGIFQEATMREVCRKYSASEIAARPVWYTCRDGHQFPDSRHLRLGRGISWSQCPHPDSFTRYCLKRTSSDYEWTGIVVQNSRDLLTSRGHAVWLAQSVQPKPLTSQVMTGGQEPEMCPCSSRSEECVSPCALDTIARLLRRPPDP